MQCLQKPALNNHYLFLVIVMLLTRLLSTLPGWIIIGIVHYTP